MKHLRRRVRRVCLVVHVAASACWLGLAVGLLGLGLSAFLLRLEINNAVTAGVPDTSLVAAPVVSSFAYFFMTAISVLKSWGATARGRKYRADSQKKVDVAPVRRTI
ncbi:hypothetical protein ABR738_20795 [Streptomyces sp. Edi4]|uniref:hypothetical protein n=1 Tax=Streptomyces sp. Edi4 TaxID=3162527 RepID=UPI003305D241